MSDILTKILDEQRRLKSVICKKPSTSSYRGSQTNQHQPRLTPPKVVNSKDPLRLLELQEAPGKSTIGGKPYRIPKKPAKTDQKKGQPSTAGSIRPKKLPQAPATRPAVRRVTGQQAAGRGGQPLKTYERKLASLEKLQRNEKKQLRRLEKRIRCREREIGACHREIANIKDPSKN